MLRWSHALRSNRYSGTLEQEYRLWDLTVGVVQENLSGGNLDQQMLSMIQGVMDKVMCQPRGTGFVKSGGERMLRDVWR